MRDIILALVGLLAALAAALIGLRLERLQVTPPPVAPARERWREDNAALDKEIAEREAYELQMADAEAFERGFAAWMDDGEDIPAGEMVIDG